MNKNSLHLALELLALLSGLPTRNRDALARDLGVDRERLMRAGQMLQAAGLAELERGRLYCTPEQLRTACRLASEPFDPPAAMW